MRSRIIAKDEATSVDRWDVPPIEASAADALRGAGLGGAHLLTTQQLDQPGVGHFQEVCGLELVRRE